MPTIRVKPSWTDVFVAFVERGLSWRRAFWMANDCLRGHSIGWHRPPQHGRARRRARGGGVVRRREMTARQRFGLFIILTAILARVATDDMTTGLFILQTLYWLAGGAMLLWPDKAEEAR